MKVQDSVVFVTGANRGLGLAIACEAQSRGAAKVYAGVRNVDGFDTGRDRTGKARHHRSEFDHCRGRKLRRHDGAD